MESDLSPRMMRHFETLTDLAIATPRVAAAKIAAAIVYKNRIIAFGVNSLKTNPFQAKFSPNENAIHLHAETSAIKNALRKVDEETLSKSILLVCRVKSADNTPHNLGWGLAKPCLGCQRAIATFNIKKVYYTCDDGIAVL